MVRVNYRGCRTTGWNLLSSSIDPELIRRLSVLECVRAILARNACSGSAKWSAHYASPQPLLKSVKTKTIAVVESLQHTRISCPLNRIGC